ncbi:MAG: rod shape-determining protein MreD [Actinomycetota bacterium]|nr:rod shape-determining protein MreD [Actinomycetota bacterium]
MTWRQAVVIGITTFLAVIVQVTLLSRLGLPGATPDLVVVTVVAIALAMGPVPGATAGFSAGILIDLAPPADTLLGVNALVYIAVGFITGFVIDPRDRTVPIMIGIVGLATAASTLAVAALDSLMGATRVSWEDMPTMVLTSALYAVAMAPLVIVGMAWVARRVAPDVSVLTG